ncbi:MAG: hypothetical protein EOP04_13195 [Proteobacteria bacterium]|nr:MAG: hypothetical protein EOP04_13195 [Pseudomonadota bacterium]
MMKKYFSKYFVVVGLVLIGLAAYLKMPQDRNSFRPSPLKKNAVNNPVRVNSIKRTLEKAKEITTKYSVSAIEKSRNELLLRQIDSRVRPEKQVFESSVSELEREQENFEKLKYALNSYILEGKPKEFVEEENLKLEIQAQVLIETQKKMNEAYKKLMVVQDEAVDELIVNK